MYLIFMGVSGAGKSTFAQLTAEAFDVPFFEADEFHPRANVEKMAAGTPLTDADRVDWLDRLCHAVCEDLATEAILSCSSLNPFVREILDQKLPAPPVYIWLDVPEETIRKRMLERTDHFMPESLLRSQFQAFEPPSDAIRIRNEGPPELVFETIKSHLIPLMERASRRT